MEHLDRITQQPDVMGGKACIRGMRVTVGMVVGIFIASQVGPEGGIRAWKWYAVVFGLLGVGLGWLLNHFLDLEEP